MTNINNTVLYIGMTNNLLRRVNEHKNGTINGFTKKYKCTKLVWFESTNEVNSAIDMEKRMKKWNREWKNKLIKKMNPEWKDLTNDLTF